MDRQDKMLQFDENGTHVIPEEDCLYGYLLLLAPDMKVTKDINELKRYFKSQYGCKNAARLTPHITLVKFAQLEWAQNRIIRHLNTFAQSVCPFDVELKGFKHFSRTFYVDVATKEPIVNLVCNLQKRYSHLLKLHQSPPYFIKNPHITVARGMTPQQLDQAVAEWEGEDYRSSFPVNEMVLIRRRLSLTTLQPLESYAPIARFAFTGKSAFGNQQLELF
jgi:2'-5' RNA ligase